MPRLACANVPEIRPILQVSAPLPPAFDRYRRVTVKRIALLIRAAAAVVPQSAVDRRQTDCSGRDLGGLESNRATVASVRRGRPLPPRRQPPRPGMTG